MSETLPSPLCCADTCCDPSPVNIPGPVGPSGANGTNGTNGVNAFTTLTAGFIMPAENADVQIAVGTTAWMVARQGSIQGQIIYIGFAGHLEVRTVDSGTLATVRNLADVVNGFYPSNAAPGVSIPSASRVSPAGIQGPDGIAPTDALLAANNLSDVDDVATSRGNLGLGTAAVVNTGISNNLIPTVDDGGGLTVGEALFATANGIESKNASASRTALGLGTLATQNAGAAAITGGTITGITDLAVADGGTGASTPAAARANLGVLAGYGLLGNLTGVNLNAANNDNALTMLSSRYRIDKITVENASISLTTATSGLFTGAGGGGTTLAADQALAALTASTKFLDLTPAGIVATDVVTAGTIYFRTGTAQGAAATADVKIFGWKYD